MAACWRVKPIQPIERKQAASLAGLAPVARQSGRWTDRAFIRGGRANVRQALYMPALVAIRYNPQLEAVYKRLKAAGKPSKIAITAAMRKLTPSPTPCSGMAENGPKSALDKHGYSSLATTSFRAVAYERSSLIFGTLG
jgi:hypothetical protein